MYTLNPKNKIKIKIQVFTKEFAAYAISFHQYYQPKNEVSKSSKDRFINVSKALAHQKKVAKVKDSNDPI